MDDRLPVESLTGIAWNTHTAQSTISPPKWRPLKSLMRQPLAQANADSSPTQADFCNRAVEIDFCNEGDIRPDEIASMLMLHVNSLSLDSLEV